MHAIRNNYDASRFNAYVDGTVAGSLHYRIQDGQMWLLDMEVAPEFRRMALEDGLVRGALADAHRRRLSVLPFCVEARRQVFADPAFARLVPAGQRDRFHKSLEKVRKYGAARSRRRTAQPAAATEAR